MEELIQRSAKYSLTKEQADELRGMALLPDEFRLQLLKRYHKQHGTKALIELFAQFMGLANSVSLNTREFVEMYLVLECKHLPMTAAKINLPTVVGALHGIFTAIPPSKGMCDGCAFRLGSVANQCEVTTLDANWSVNNLDKNFYCHEDLKPNGEPQHLCAGYAKAAGPASAAVAKEAK